MKGPEPPVRASSVTPVAVHLLATELLAFSHRAGDLPVRWEMVVRLLAALGLTWCIGFERELRGSPAGDRTFALIGVGSAVVGYLALNDAPNALAGVVTGIGFIGAGVIIHGGKDMIHGVTTAATIYLAAAVGAAAGQGQLLMALVATAMTLLILEVRHVKHLRWADGGYWAMKLSAQSDDDDFHVDPEPER